MKKLIFLKLGGSLITDKDQESTVLNDRLINIGDQIKKVTETDPDISLIIGHGSGSYGHHAAKKYGTQAGFTNPEAAVNYWQGFNAVYQQAHLLNQYVVQALQQTGNPVIAFSPNAAVKTKNRSIVSWDLEPLKAALQANFIPVVFGDVVFDDSMGGTILSTEDLFCRLANILKPQQIFLAGIEEGVWQDYPTRESLVRRINQSNYLAFQNIIKESGSIDVTGGMESKVKQMLDLTDQVDGLSVRIFSGSAENAIYRALSGEDLGTLIKK